MPPWTTISHLTIWAAFALIWAILLPPGKKGSDYQQRSSYNGALYITGSISALLYLTGFGAIDLLFTVQKEVGVAVSCLGLAAAIHARRVIGEHWTFHATARTDGQFVQRFPYNIVRHPIYTAQIVMCFGTSLSSSNIGVATVFTVGTYLLLLQRAKKEEALLDASTDGNYSQRFAHIGCFFPKFSSK